MKKTNKLAARIGGVSLSLAMMVGTFAACGGDSAPADPKEAIKQATTTTTDAFMAMDDTLGADALIEMLATEATREEFSLTLTDASIGIDVSELFGTTINLTADTSIADRKLNSLTEVIIGDTTVSLNAMLDDAILYLGSAEIFGDTIIGVDTVNPDPSLQATGVMAEGVNVFDILENYKNYNSLAPETNDALDAAFHALVDASTVGEATDAKMTSNGTEIDTSMYSAEIPTEAFSTYIETALTTIYSDPGFKSIMEYSITSTGMYASYDEFVAEIVDEVVMSFESSDLNPIKADFYTSDNTLRGVDITISDEVEEMTSTVRFGAENVVDHVEFTMTIPGGDEFSVVSSGTHSFEETFTNNTVFSINSATTGIINMEMDTTWNTKTGAYTVEADIDDGTTVGTFSSEGTYKLSDESVELVIEDLTFDMAGMSVTFEGSYSAAKSEGVTLDTTGAVMMADMTEDEQMDMSLEVQNNLYTLLNQIMTEIPTLMAMFA